ncbi:hypothetical protein C8R43DRAFT_943498 [Mycena crocata]|nr:hypothetical protein C8R43DRAFT_943498 [Mycena crocata]
MPNRHHGPQWSPGGTVATHAALVLHTVVAANQSVRGQSMRTNGGNSIYCLGGRATSDNTPFTDRDGLEIEVRSKGDQSWGKSKCISHRRYHPVRKLAYFVQEVCNAWILVLNAGDSGGTASSPRYVVKDTDLSGHVVLLPPYRRFWIPMVGHTGFSKDKNRAADIIIKPQRLSSLFEIFEGGIFVIYTS